MILEKKFINYSYYYTNDCFNKKLKTPLSNPKMYLQLSNSY